MNHESIREVKSPFTKKQLLALTEAKKTGKKVLIEKTADETQEFSAFAYTYAYPSGKVRTITYFITD